MRYRDAVSPHGMKVIARFCKDGLNDREIAEQLDVGPVTLSRWRARSEKLRTTMDVARGKATIDAQTGYLTKLGDKRRELKTKKLYKPSLRQEQWNLTAVRDTIHQWEFERKRDKLPLTRESLCQMLGISLGDFNKIVNDKVTVEATEDEMEHCAVTDTVQPGIIAMIKSADRAILSELADRCLTKNSNGAIFLLKNHYDYTDKKSLDITDTDYSVRWEQTADGDGRTYILTDPAKKHKG